MEKMTFFAKVDSINETTYDTYTLSVLNEKNERKTLRIDKNEKVDLNAVYEFEVEEIEFKERIQFLVHEYTHINNVKVPIERKTELMGCFYEYAPVEVTEIKSIIETYLGKIENKIIKDITLELYHKFKEPFYLYPAATRFHHAYISGLSYHTSTMMKMIDGFMKVYPFLNQDLLIAGILLHDICKVEELSNFAGPEYTKVGKLLGHITMGVKEVEMTAEKFGYRDSEEVLLLEHIILSHHYFGNFGSPKKPNIPEALVVHFIDNIDSKLTVLMEAFDEIDQGEFTSPIGVLDREKYYKSTLK